MMRRLAGKLLSRTELLPFQLAQADHEFAELVVVTGADSSHFQSLCQFLSSLRQHEPEIVVIAFDLGLKKSERLQVAADFPTIELRTFDFPQYPDYLNVKINAGQYAWKPVIINDVLNEFKCCVCWMDAGNVVTEPLRWVRTITKSVGLYSPHSSGEIKHWTHPKTLEYLDVSADLLDRPNLSGGCVAACYSSPEARELVRQWKECALIKACIAPPGSSRENHRQDQAVLSVLAHQSGITSKMPRGCYGFKFHQDIE